MKHHEMNIVPLSDKVVVKRNKDEGMTPGGILIPDVAKEKARMGKVLAVGEGAINKDGSLRKMSVKEGDTVLFSSYSGSEVELGGEKYLLMSEQEILGRIVE